MKENYDISRVPENGYLIIPISMSRIANAHSPEKIYDFLKFFEDKVTKISLDVVFLYTDGLYVNTAENALEFRKKTINQIQNHRSVFTSLLLKEKKYIPQAFHFLPWDYAVINAPDYISIKTKIEEGYKNNEGYRLAIDKDLEKAGRELSDANISFIIEETIISHLLIQKQIPLPNTLTASDGWRLVCYPGEPIQSWKYLYANKILELRNDFPGNHLSFASGFYNMEDKKFINLTLDK